MAHEDFYKVLGVSKSSSEDEIRKAYRKLAREYHPDRRPDDKQAAEKFQQIQQAYDVLGDAEKRQKYDMYGAAYQQGHGTYAGPDGQPIDLNDLFGGAGGGGFEDIFSSMFGGGGRQRGRGRQPMARKGEDIRAEVTVPFTTCALGGEYDLTLNKQGRPETLTMRIPEGLSSGATIRLQGQGHAGMGGGPNGDLLVTVNAAVHPHFKREKNNIVHEVAIGIADAALGTAVDVKTIHDEEVTVNIPPGTASGSRLRLREQGVLDPKTKKRGDQFLAIKIVPPSELSERQKELLEEFRAEESPADD